MDGIVLDSYLDGLCSSFESHLHIAMRRVKELSKEVPSRELSLVLTKLEEAGHWWTDVVV